MPVFAGIGNRYRVPSDALQGIQLLAEGMARAGWAMRTGGAIGCDAAFALGHQRGAAVSHVAAHAVYSPTSAAKDAMLLASGFHPRWENCSPDARRLLGRNAEIVLGDSLSHATAVDLVMAYAADENHGGTAHAIRIARHYGITVVNLAKGRWRREPCQHGCPHVDPRNDCGHLFLDTQDDARDALRYKCDIFEEEWRPELETWLHAIAADEKEEPAVRERAHDTIDIHYRRDE